MGLFDLFRGKNSPSGEEKDLVRLQKMVSNKLSQNIDREDALHRLAEMKTAPAAKVLLSRFSWTLNPTIKDQEEKEIAVMGIVAAGEPALQAVRDYCVRAETLTWPLKAIRQIVGEERFEEELLSLLDEFDTEYVRDPEPKIQLMKALAEFSSEEVCVGVQPFLLDMSEEVRFAAAATVLGCQRPESVESLVDALIQEESLRVKNRIAQGLVEAGWAVPEAQREGWGRACPPGFSLATDGAVQGRPVS